MQLKQCEKGHFYDQTIHNACPYCNGENSNANERTTFVHTFDENDRNPTQPVGGNGGFTKLGDDTGVGRTDWIGGKNSIPPNHQGKTQVIIKQQTGVDPVVGWLVCVEGAEKGKDYRIHADNNFIGRDDRMDICIRGDSTVSRENHAILSFDNTNQIFYFSPGSGRSIVRVNGIAVFATVALQPYDMVEIGTTKLKFVPFCGGDFSWMA